MTAYNAKGDNSDPNNEKVQSQATKYLYESEINASWWTDEYEDDHTHAAIIRGGGSYQPAGSKWYFPRNTRLQEHGKYLLMAPSKDRSAMIGFRCVVDAR